MRRAERGALRGYSHDVATYAYPLTVDHSRTKTRRVIVTDTWTENVVQTLDFYPYGSTRISVATSTNEKRKFIGQFADDSSLSYLNARYYNATQGQFISQDPVFLGDPMQQDLNNPQNLNSYSYARGHSAGSA
jgi:RHS repeat-associated protein